MWSRQRFQQLRWSIFAGVAVLVTLAVFSVAHSVSGAQRAAIPTATPRPCSQSGPAHAWRGPVYPYPPGAPAIPVKSAIGAGPDFTVADVTAYVSTHLMANQTPGAAPNQLVRASFLTATEVSQRFHDMYVAPLRRCCV